ncbi:unnamed protein product [Gadus morhua 'NCC']
MRSFPRSLPDQTQELHPGRWGLPLGEGAVLSWRSRDRAVGGWVFLACRRTRSEGSRPRPSGSSPAAAAAPGAGRGLQSHRLWDPGHEV